ncbi:hypothetical protein ACFSRY_09615 [Pontibacter locisalis]|uniref:Uncharacterized protein n=1 Tax=Pontibacter locisalis TaxID=1719035 RepID=A0ABW5IM78_9BACT
MGTPLHAKAWVWVYIKALLLIVVVPYICAESIMMAIMPIEDWSYNRTIVLLPHYFNLVIDRRINSFIRNIFKL